MKACLPPRYRDIYWCPYELLLSEHLHPANAELQQERLSDNEIRALAGNGMAFVVVGTAFMLGMAIFEKVPGASLHQRLKTTVHDVTLPHWVVGCLGGGGKKFPLPRSLSHSLWKDVV